MGKRMSIYKKVGLPYFGKWSTRMQMYFRLSACVSVCSNIFWMIKCSFSVSDKPTYNEGCVNCSLLIKLHFRWIIPESKHIVGYRNTTGREKMTRPQFSCTKKTKKQTFSNFFSLNGPLHLRETPLNVSTIAYNKLNRHCLCRYRIVLNIKIINSVDRKYRLSFNLNFLPAIPRSK